MDSSNCQAATATPAELSFSYTARSTAQRTERRVSPQRLTHYRDNWYLDAWDPGASSLRCFALDLIVQPRLENEAAVEMSEAQLDALQEGGYGIFSGPVVGNATIRFSPHAARWVAHERWHPEQTMRHLDDGSLELDLPYSKPFELLKDVQRYGAEAQVLSPPELRQQMREQLVAALDLYGR